MKHSLAGLPSVVSIGFSRKATSSDIFGSYNATQSAILIPVMNGYSKIFGSANKKYPIRLQHSGVIQSVFISHIKKEGIILASSRKSYPLNGTDQQELCTRPHNKPIVVEPQK